MSSTPVVMSVAGSDCSGGAGIQADLKTFSHLNCYGTTAVTCIVAENPTEVRSITSLPAKKVREQMELIFDAFPVSVVKTGMLYSNSIIKEVCSFLKQIDSLKRPKIVVDPVMVSTTGTKLLRKNSIQTLLEELFPIATLITPNIHEAQLLLAKKIVNELDAEQAAELLCKRWGAGVLVKGGHLAKDAVDFLAASKTHQSYRTDRIRGVKTNGTGCTYSAAIAAYLAQGNSLTESVGLAKSFMTRAIKSHLKLGHFKALNHYVVEP
ncbi:MAG: bifunctional hydroxymethylpyrimidine kinase/phosphomethylpyrimidine kinase [Verrucomicrobiota bacterium]